MTVTIKDKDNNIVGTAKSISIDVEYAKEKFQPTEIVRDEQGNYVSSKPVGEPIYLESEAIITFTLDKECNSISLVNIEATKFIYNNETLNNSCLLVLENCTINGKLGKASNLKFIDLSSLEAVFNYYFPNITEVKASNRVLNADLDTDGFVGLTIYKEKDIYNAKLYFDSLAFIFLHESTDLNELMQVTKQKLTDMFAEWSSKVN